jgi:hypothetical protein
VLFLADILPTAYEVGVLVSRLEPGDTRVRRRFATHRYALAHSEKAYDVFADAASSQALKVVLDAEPVRSKHDADRAVAIA